MKKPRKLSLKQRDKKYGTESSVPFIAFYGTHKKPTYNELKEYFVSMADKIFNDLYRLRFLQIRRAPFVKKSPHLCTIRILKDDTFYPEYFKVKR